jgi:hypothetical protein
LQSLGSFEWCGGGECDEDPPPPKDHASLKLTIILNMGYLQEMQRLRIRSCCSHSQKLKNR